MKVRISASAYSSRGKVRQCNEDSFILFKKKCMPPETVALQSASTEQNNWCQWYGVFDGMGGEECGEKASFAAANSLHKNGRILRVGNAIHRLKVLGNKLNAAVDQALEGKNGGCTMAISLIRGSKLFTAHAGDSRIYLYRDDVLTRLTSDHTPPDRVYYVAHGKKREKIVHRSHSLYRFLGTYSSPELCEVGNPIKLIKGDKILMCSDGLSDMLDDSQLLSHLRKSDPPETLALMLHDDAMAAGGKDNITVLIISIL